MAYSREDVQSHTVGYGGLSYPAVNVKAYSFAGVGAVGVVMDRFSCSEKTAERALEWAYEMAKESFWESAKELVEHRFPGAQCWSEGRQGGWLLVQGLPSVDGWDAIVLGVWHSFEKDIKAMVVDACDSKCVLDDIDANRWAEDNAEQYNFLDRGGETICLADVERCAHCGR